MPIKIAGLLLSVNFSLFPKSCRYGADLICYKNRQFKRMKKLSALSGLLQFFEQVFT